MAYFLLLLGLVFLWLEFYLPGGAFAVASAIFVLGALGTFFAASPSVIASVLFFVGACILVVVVIRLAIWRIKKSATKNTFFLSKDQEGFMAAELSDDIVGKRGTTLTECGPSGYALVEGKRIPIICRGPYLDKGVEVQIITIELGNYVVKPVR